MQGSKDYGVTLFLVFSYFLLLFCSFFAFFLRHFGAVLVPFWEPFWANFRSILDAFWVGMAPTIIRNESNLFHIWYLKWWFLCAILDEFWV